MAHFSEMSVSVLADITGVDKIQFLFKRNSRNLLST